MFRVYRFLKTGHSEIKITKKHGNGFKDTGLNEVLIERVIKRIYICGFAAEGCVHNTYMGGIKLKYETLKITMRLQAIASCYYISSTSLERE